MLPAAGQPISAVGMTLKVGAIQTPTWSALEAVAPPHYLAELGQLRSRRPPGQPPTPEAVAAVRARHDIHQITPLIPGGMTTVRPGGSG